ncbi:hypothetical protein LMG27952_06894 [Paraburkholderia hiiakae]|uniref:Uncharacterized protein n=1 Tax=Paraburkholderia hiiakae TaxID=1081782 RepID=A0ABN7IDC6_9BURK|nr:hypothetical protein [Paraburkholderia hiiakae]CAD6559558.1 hypothetical protein LMG27952_06894 [Paraburkholderia hiiakae]
MTKDEYLTGEVKKFVVWMSEHLDRKTFAHAYRNRKSGMKWECRSLYDAYVQYAWRHDAIDRLGVEEGNTFTSNAKALAKLQSDLLAALDSTCSNRDAAAAAIDVMIWGGVRRGNVNWLLRNEAGLVKLINATRLAFEAGDTTHAILKSGELRFNAGMTKVYSLVCGDFIIYDSRVAAALGWAVVKYCRSRGISRVPDGLRFPWAPGYEATNARAPKQRNPRDGDLTFPRLQSGPMHAEWNMRANWILTDVLAQEDSRLSSFSLIADEGTRLRALESALFMIGYDLNPASAGDAVLGDDGPSGNPPIDDEVAVSDEPRDGWVPCKTLGRATPFRYRIDAASIETTADDAVQVLEFSDEIVNRTLTLLVSAEENGEKPFGLHNSATEARDPNGRWGMGKAYRLARNGNGNAPDTSRLVAILEEVGVLERVQDEPHLAWWLATQVDVENGRVDVRPLLDRHLSHEQEA